eukprot:TRINITY_DN2789_c0_g1_i1.p1 TRINITY_DN2789_c0_g1~~TRINITY_DN2789_c0_g1_i1.p1  ORF type:complete len:203 (-),score=45.22 TRINITY_DN2789_c0_g1_i1:94-702(-)
MAEIEKDSNLEHIGLDQEGEEDPELEEMKRRLKEMEEESSKLSALQTQVESMTGTTDHATAANKEEVDSRSIHIGNVDFGSTPEELQAHFQSCGTINRVTILCDKFTGHPKGFAYIEFLDKESVANAMVMNESLFRGRQIKVTPKRTNLPVFLLAGRGRGTAFPSSSYPTPGYTRGGRGVIRGFATRGRYRATRRPYYHPYH